VLRLLGVAILTAPSRRDVAIAAAAVATVAAGSWLAARSQQPPRPLDFWAYALVTVAAGGLAWRRTAPAVVLACGVAATGGYLLLGYPYGPVLLCVGVATFELGRRRPPRVSTITAALAALVSVATVLPRLEGELTFLAVGLALWAGCWLAVPWAIGALFYVRGQAADRERRDLVARAALEERIRVSRAVHDVAGHGFAVIAMQAGVALVVLDEQPDQVRAALEAIRATSTDALGELRQVLDPRGPAVIAEPSLRSLVERARTAGLDVEVCRSDAGGLPPTAEALVYRVVRESLTNVLRHAGPATARVVVERLGAEVRLTVSDNGTGPTPARNATGPTTADDRTEPTTTHHATGPTAAHGTTGPTAAPDGTRPPTTHHASGPTTAHDKIEPTTTHHATGPTAAHDGTGRTAAPDETGPTTADDKTGRAAAAGDRTTQTGPAARDGTGIAGMRSAVTAAGGQLTAEPGPDGGFVVHARFPLAGEQ